MTRPTLDAGVEVPGSTLETMDRVLLMVAMEAEAAPLVDALAATEADRRRPLPMRVYAASVRGMEVRIVVNGRDPRYGADSIGTIPAALSTHVAISEWRPDIVLSVGTAGGWQRHGSKVGDVYVAWDRFVFHDHRIPLSAFAAMATADVAATDLRNLARDLGFRVGVVTTGDSLDESPEDRVRIISSGAAVKDMEAAAVAWVAELHDVPVSAIKAVTDLVDDPTPTSEQFTANLSVAARALERATVAALDWLAASGRQSSDG